LRFSSATVFGKSGTITRHRNRSDGRLADVGYWHFSDMPARPMSASREKAEVDGGQFDSRF